MQRTAVRSSDIAIIGYDHDSETLEVCFKNGGVYRYSGVPESAYQELMSSASHGTYFNTHIKDKFEFQKIK